MKSELAAVEKADMNGQPIEDSFVRVGYAKDAEYAVNEQIKYELALFCTVNRRDMELQYLLLSLLSCTETVRPATVGYLAYYICNSSIVAAALSTTCPMCTTPCQPTLTETTLPFLAWLPTSVMHLRRRGLMHRN